MITMAHRGLIHVALAAGVLLATIASAEACNCPKEQLIKKYGTVSQVREPSQPLPLPPPLPVSKVSAPAGG
jgi:hypothetical protein